MVQDVISQTMNEYIYDLATDPRYVLSEYYRPLPGIRVTHRDRLLCVSELTAVGVVVMDIPDDLVTKLEGQDARILAWSQIVPERHIGDEVQRKQLFHLEIIDSVY